MSYLALYRRFRPKVFEDLIGQETVVKALINQIKNDKIGHAYLFCGARGTGKTTVAKIFAKAINCESGQGSPCGKCDTCKKLEDQTNLDIIEMDAASNNKVENVREIREMVQYPPVAGKYKVYIIDEVHMLTTEAFNALLKTLEEPPKHAVFVLATTEPHKLPQTILSRCMRFDFKLVSNELIAKLICKIFDEVQKEYDQDAVNLIAKSGEGSVRDALSIADICVSFSDKKLTYSDVLDVLGATDKQKISQLVSNIIDSNLGEALLISDKLLSLGKSVMLLSRDILSYLRELLVVKSCKNASQILGVPNSDIQELLKIANNCDTHRLLRCVEIFSGVENDLKYSTHARIVFETALVKATQSQSDYNIDALIARITKLEETIKNLQQGGFREFQADRSNQTAPKNQEPSFEKQETKQVEIKQETKQETKQVVEKEQPAIQTNTQVLQPTTVEKPQVLQQNRVEEQVVSPPRPQINERRIWGNILKRLRETNKMLWVACQELETEIKDRKLVIRAQDQSELKMLQKQENLKILNDILNEFAPFGVEVLSYDGGVIKQEDTFDLTKIKENFEPIKIED